MKQLTSAFVLLASSSYLYAAFPQDISNLQIRVGHPSITLGPAANMIDNPYVVVQLPNGSFRSFTANATTYRIDSNNPTGSGGTAPVSVIGPIANGYADCGLWINDIFKDNDYHYFGLAHAETQCTNGTHKSMAVLESIDQGAHWVLQGQIITGMDNPTPGKNTGEGDCTAISDSDYHYLYCLRNSDYKMIVARTPNTCALPNKWMKYYNGTWNSPGLSGAATALDGPPGTVSKWTDTNYVMSLAPSYQSSGITLYFSADRLHFVQLIDPLLINENASWNRTSQSTELLVYLSALNYNGGREWSNGKFLLSYTYLEPGAGFDKRYLVFRDATISIGSVTNKGGEIPQVGVELSRWLNPTNSPAPEIWTTTAAVPGNYTKFQYKGSLGYVMTKPLTGTGAQPTVGLEECISYWTGNADHFITWQGTCVGAGYKRLRAIGWIYQNSQPNTAPLYRCWSPTKYRSHFMSLQADCEGEKTEFTMGYILKS